MIGFTLLLLTPIVVMYGSEKQSITNQVSFTQANQIATKIADSAETVYYLGKPSRTTIRVNIPYNVVDFTFNGREVIITLDMGTTTAEVVAVSTVNMSGDFSAKPGLHEIAIIAEENYVNVTNA